jgi:predicted RNA-binding protein YlxR (DUF448 family)
VTAPQETEPEELGPPNLAPEADDESGPLRRCVATGERLAPERMVRFVVGPGDLVVPDIAAKLPGRGMWVKAEPEALRRAVAKHLFARAARRAVTVEPDLPATVERLLARQCLDLLGLAKRAGTAVAGFDKVEALLRHGGIGVLIAASDGAADGRGKLRRLAPDAPLVSQFPAAVLAGTLGRDGVVVHAAIARGKLAHRFVAAADRLASLRGLA